eukprot:TRINITY_DN18541_c0_g1_i1.p1 TRINITY_DN18541_c0_g1~~TRINITY_DN18541_c0_g1_i1.p1  ORF type:complete len:246 (-),score=37.61 TRINITY_DN18541_c0_g1_i1:365-1102(-)
MNGDSPETADMALMSSTSSNGLKDAAWSEDTQCQICGTALGKRRLKPRHHCRICGQSVCSACSPNSIQLDDKKGMQRACTPCIRNAQIAPAVLDRLTVLHENLRILGQSSQTDRGRSNSGAHASEPTHLHSIEQALSVCETAAGQAVSVVEQERRAHQKLVEQNERLAAQLQEERRIRRELEDKASKKLWWRGEAETASDMSGSTRAEGVEATTTITPASTPGRGGRDCGHRRQTCVDRSKCVIS